MAPGLGGVRIYERQDGIGEWAPSDVYRQDATEFSNYSAQRIHSVATNGKSIFIRTELSRVTSGPSRCWVTPECLHMAKNSLPGQATGQFRPKEKGQACDLSFGTALPWRVEGLDRRALQMPCRVLLVGVGDVQNRGLVEGAASKLEGQRQFALAVRCETAAHRERRAADHAE